MVRRRLLARLLPVVFAVAALAAVWLTRQPAPFDPVARTAPAEWRAGEMVEVEGRVSRLLSDDRDGSRHQRFIVTLEGGRTLLVAHNIDLAPRVPLEVGDRTRVRGQYEPSARGGVLHWTHHDPAGARRDTGWIEHHGKVYD